MLPPIPHGLPTKCVVCREPITRDTGEFYRVVGTVVAGFCASHGRVARLGGAVVGEAARRVVGRRYPKALDCIRFIDETLKPRKEA